MTANLVPTDYRQCVIGMIDTYLKMFPDDEWGFAHIVLSDYNTSDYFIHWCLNQPDVEKPARTRAFLEFLLTIPEAQGREPDDR